MTTTTIISLLTNEPFAASIIESYCKWNEEDSSPFKTNIGGTLYATTGSLLSLLNVERPRFIYNRCTFSSLYIDLGSLRLEDTTLRGQVITDPRLKVSWFHNARSVSLSLLSHQPLFNAFLGHLGDKLANKYSLGWLESEYRSDQLKLIERSELLKSARREIVGRKKVS